MVGRPVGARDSVPRKRATKDEQEKKRKKAAQVETKKKGEATTQGNLMERFLGSAQAPRPDPAPHVPVRASDPLRREPATVTTSRPRMEVHFAPIGEPRAQLDDTRPTSDDDASTEDDDEVEQFLDDAELAEDLDEIEQGNGLMQQYLKAVQTRLQHETCPRRQPGPTRGRLASATPEGERLENSSNSGEAYLQKTRNFIWRAFLLPKHCCLASRYRVQGDAPLSQ